MAEQKAKAKGRKIGRGKRQNLRSGYKPLAAKKRRIERMMRRFPGYSAPGWEMRKGIGLVCLRKRGGA